MVDPAKYELKLPPPDEGFEPLKANILELGRITNGTLTPMFPYTHKGAIVPALVVTVGGQDHRWDTFKHYNDVDEIYVVFSAQGRQASAGMVMLGTREHFVNAQLGDDQNPENHAFVSVVQRQWEKDEPQAERVVMLCAQCQEPMLTHAFAGEADGDTLAAARASGVSLPFRTPIESAHAAELFNAAPRVCSECGFENPPFRLEEWGWQRYAEQAKSSLDAAAVLRQAYATPQQGAA